MNIRILTLLLSAATLLSGCNLLNVLPTVDLNVSFVDTADPPTNTQLAVLVFVDNDTAAISFAIPRVRFKAFSNPGSMATNITGYSIEYFYATGDKIATATGESFRGTLAMNVPDGISCGQPLGAVEPIPCGVNSANATYERGPDVFSDPFSPIDSDIIRTLYFGTNPKEGAYASVTIEGTDANGNYFSQFLSPVTITFRAGE